MSSNPVVDANVSSGVRDSTGGSPLSNAIGTNLPSGISQTGINRSDDTVSSSGVVSGGTEATAVYYFRTPMADVILDATAVPGNSLITVPVNVTIDPQVKNLANEYQKYRFKDLTVALVNNSPFGTTSGSIVVGHIPDPSNNIPTDSTKALQMATRLSGSRVVTPRNSVEIKPALGSDWKWAKPAGTPRLESFGNLFVLVRQPCAKDSVAQWNVTVSGTVEFAESTINSSSITTRSVYEGTAVNFTKPELIQLEGNPEFFLSFELNTINVEGRLVAENLLLADVTITDGTDTDAFSFNITQMDVLNLKQGFRAVCETVIRDVTVLDQDKLSVVAPILVNNPVGYSFYVSRSIQPVQPSSFFSFDIDPTLMPTPPPRFRTRRRDCNVVAKAASPRTSCYE